MNFFGEYRVRATAETNPLNLWDSDGRQTLRKRIIDKSKN